MSPIPLWHVYIECFVVDEALNEIKLYYTRNYTECFTAWVRCSCTCMSTVCVYFWFNSPFHVWNDCNCSCFNQSTSLYANRWTIPYPINNTLVVPPNYMELFMSIRVINRVWNDLYTLHVYICTFVLYESSTDHFTASFYANLWVIGIGSRVTVWYQ
jgi:hypothetical protein